MKFWSSDKDTKPFSSLYLGFLQKGDYAMILTEKFSLLFGRNETRIGVWRCFEGVTRASKPVVWLAAILEFFFPKRLAHDLGENLNFGYFIVLGKIESKNGLCCFFEK